MNPRKFEEIVRKWLPNLPEREVLSVLSQAEVSIAYLVNFKGSKRAKARKHFVAISETAEKLSELLAHPPFAQVLAGDLADHCGAPIKDLPGFFRYLRHIEVLAEISRLRAGFIAEGGGRHRWEDEAGMPTAKLFAAVVACLIWSVAFGTLPDDESVPFGDFIDALWTANAGKSARESWPRHIQEARKAIRVGEKVTLERQRAFVPAPGGCSHPLDGLERTEIAFLNAYDWAIEILSESGFKPVVGPHIAPVVGLVG